MKTVDFFVKPPGTKVTMRAQANDQVVTFVVFVRKFTSAGPIPVVTWHPDQLESGNATLVVEPERGYDFDLKASIRNDGGAAIDIQFDFDDGDVKSYPQEPLPASEGPVVGREWSLIVRAE
jgi:hypothetical protein